MTFAAGGIIPPQPHGRIIFAEPERGQEQFIHPRYPELAARTRYLLRSLSLRFKIADLEREYIAAACERDTPNRAP